MSEYYIEAVFNVPGMGLLTGVNAHGYPDRTLDHLDLYEVNETDPILSFPNPPTTDEWDVIGNLAWGKEERTPPMLSEDGLFVAARVAWAIYDFEKEYMTEGE